MSRDKLLKAVEKNTKAGKNRDESLFEDSLSPFLSTQINPVSLNQLFPAPESWNFFSPLPEEKMYDLMESIIRFGVLEPIIVWERSKGSYMILSGHNRVHACEVLSKENVKYRQIPAIIKKKDELTEIQARGIIVDMNFAKRVLTPPEIRMSIVVKYEEFKNEEGEDYSKRRFEELLAEHFNMSDRVIRNYLAIDHLIEQWKTLFMKGDLSFKMAQKIARLDEKVQNHLYDHYRTKLQTKHLEYISKEMTTDDIDLIFTKDNVQIARFTIPRTITKHKRQKLKKEIEDLIRRYEAGE